jgi:hypothetical protein
LDACHQAEGECVGVAAAEFSADLRTRHWQAFIEASE